MRNRQKTKPIRARAVMSIFAIFSRGYALSDAFCGRMAQASGSSFPVVGACGRRNEPSELLESLKVVFQGCPLVEFWNQPGQWPVGISTTLD